MKQLTTKQKNILHYIKTFANKKGYQPSYKEIGDNFNITASAVYYFLKRADKKKYIKMTGQSRSIQFLKDVNT